MGFGVGRGANGIWKLAQTHSVLKCYILDVRFKNVIPSFPPILFSSIF